MKCEEREVSTTCAVRDITSPVRHCALLAFTPLSSTSRGPQATRARRACPDASPAPCSTASRRWRTRAAPSTTPPPSAWSSGSEVRRPPTTGVGKSGLIAARMASSLSSIGLPSQWVHGAEWAHGELGNLRGDDVIVAVSNSGRTAELLWLGEQLARRGDGGALVALTGGADSPLARCRASRSRACRPSARRSRRCRRVARRRPRLQRCSAARARTQLSDEDVRRATRAARSRRVG